MPMLNQKNNSRRDTERHTPSDIPMRRMLPFVIEFVKFSTAFAVVIAAALITLHVATAASF